MIKNLAFLSEIAYNIIYRFYAMGVSMYGEMTAGCYCYIGP